MEGLKLGGDIFDRFDLIAAGALIALGLVMLLMAIFRVLDDYRLFWFIGGTASLICGFYALKASRGGSG